MTAIRIVGFNGLGEPTVDGVNDGDVLILVRGNDVSIVKLELLVPDHYGPSLDHASNESELEGEARSVVEEQHPMLFESEKHWTLECPPEIARRAIFAS